MAIADPAVEPLIALRVPSRDYVFRPGEVLRCEYQIDAVPPSKIRAVEASVLWYTEGKGDEDLFVHHFQRFTPSDVVDGDLRHMHVLETTLPRSPLSYDGQIVKICWCARVRLFWGRGKECLAERPFRLAPIPRDDPSERQSP